MLKIVDMDQPQLLILHPASLINEIGEKPRLLTKEEIIHIARTLGAFWAYDYQALERGKPGLHAQLKSGLHSDGFFTSRIFLKPWNIKLIIADQLALRFRQLKASCPEWVAGIPDGATELGEEVAGLLGSNPASMKKENGRISIESEIPAGETLLLVEDICTRGTGFTEAVQDILIKRPNARILPYELVIVNRGGLSEIRIPATNGQAEFTVKIVPLVDHRLNDWDPDVCPLCKKGSKPIKPKEADESWRLITTSQL